MLLFLKKLFKSKVDKIQIVDKTLNILNKDLVLRLNKLISYDNLNYLFLSPISKIYIINTYTNNFNDLISNVYNQAMNRSIIAINLYSYFNDRDMDIRYHLGKITEHLPTVKLSLYIEHDLFQLCNTFDELVEMEKINV